LVAVFQRIWLIVRKLPLFPRRLRASEPAALANAEVLIEADRRRLDHSSLAGFRWPTAISIGDNRPMRSTQELMLHAKFLRNAIELRGEFFHCGIFEDNFAGLSTVQSYLCGD